jgi:hypothetical protein
MQLPYIFQLNSRLAFHRESAGSMLLARRYLIYLPSCVCQVATQFVPPGPLRQEVTRELCLVEAM